MRIIFTLAAAALIGAAGAAAAQEFDTDAAIESLEQDNERLRQMEEEVFPDAARDPRVQADYQRHRAGGGQMGWEEFVRWHAYTNGGTTPFRPQMPGRAPTMGQWVIDRRTAVIAGGDVSGPDENGQCWIVGGTSAGSPAECPR